MFKNRNFKQGQILKLLALRKEDLKITVTITNVQLLISFDRFFKTRFRKLGWGALNDQNCT